MCVWVFHCHVFDVEYVVHFERGNRERGSSHRLIPTPCEYHGSYRCLLLRTLRSQLSNIKHIFNFRSRGQLKLAAQSLRLVVADRISPGQWTAWCRLLCPFWFLCAHFPFLLSRRPCQMWSQIQWGLFVATVAPKICAVDTPVMRFSLQGRSGSY